MAWSTMRRANADGFIVDDDFDLGVRFDGNLAKNLRSKDQLASSHGIMDKP